jgi:tetratricopeptide (TPR) repeat protein
VQHVSWFDSPGSTATLLSELTPGRYERSNLAVGEQKDIAQQRGRALGFVRSAPLEQYLNQLRAKLVAASRQTGVPGRVLVLANPEFNAYSTPDGNVYVAMGCLESFKTEDEVTAILAHETSHVLLTYHRLLDTVSVSHPKTEDRIEETAEYIERHYGNRDMRDPRSAPWKAVTSEPAVALVMQHYHLAFQARRMLDKRNPRSAYASAEAAATAPTAGDAYPNWVLAQSANALGRRAEAIEALRRAINSAEPVPPVYEEIIFAYERAGNLAVALEWTDRAERAFGGAPRWKPHKIRLLREQGRVAEASSLTLDCSVNAPEWRRLCQEANQTPARRRQR